MEKESQSNLCSCLASLVLSTILVLFLLFCSLSFFFPPISESSWHVLILTILLAFLSTLFILVTLRKKKGSEPEGGQSVLVHEMKMQKETGIALINNNNEQEAESQSDSSFPSDSETTIDSAMDDKFELNVAKNTTTSLPSSDAETESITNGETESLELDQNSDRVLGFYESSNSDNEDDGDDDDGDDDDDDDLIEINLPSSHFCGQKLYSKLPDFLPEDMFKQEGLMELLAEMNEDENLIEIDISMGLKQELPFSGDQYSYSVLAD